VSYQRGFNSTLDIGKNLGHLSPFLVKFADSAVAAVFFWLEDGFGNHTNTPQNTSYGRLVDYRRCWGFGSKKKTRLQGSAAQ
jgi:hypothetical protein